MPTLDKVLQGLFSALKFPGHCHKSPFYLFLLTELQWSVRKGLGSLEIAVCARDSVGGLRASSSVCERT